MILSKFKEDFSKRYADNKKPIRFFSAPLSLTLSGSLGSEHGGETLLLPVSLKVTCGLRRRADSIVNLEESSTNTLLSRHKAMFNSTNATYEADLSKKIYERYSLKIGVDMLFHSDSNALSTPLPDNSATSICMITALSAAFDLSAEENDQIRLCEAAEKSPSHLGAVHKLCALHAEKNAVFSADCTSLRYQNYPYLTEPYFLLILHTKNAPSHHKNKEKIDAGMRILRERNPKLSDCKSLTIEQIQESSHRLSSSQKHLLTALAEEQRRITECKKALQNNDLAAFCSLLNARASVSDQNRELLYCLPEISGVMHTLITDDDDIICFVQKKYVESAMNDIYKNLQQDRAFLIADTASGVLEYKDAPQTNQA